MINMFVSTILVSLICIIGNILAYRPYSQRIIPFQKRTNFISDFQGSFQSSYSTWRIQGKKIEDAEEELGIKVEKKRKSSSSSSKSKSKSTKSNKLSNSPEFTETSSNVSEEFETKLSLENSTEVSNIETNMNQKPIQYDETLATPLLESSGNFDSSRTNLFSTPQIPAPPKEVGSGSSTLLKASQASKAFESVQQVTTDPSEELTNPLETGTIPPEIVFFGDPRRPPPGEASRDPKYHGKLLYWARHAYAAPRTSQERLASVFPTGRLHPFAPKFRFEDAEKLSYEMIYLLFKEVMDDLEDSKAFLSSNIDLVPSKLFLRALSAQKLEAQYKNNLDLMNEIKQVRDKYILAHDQLFFPLNLEVAKAETRVMTYLARQEIREFANKWDDVEMSLHYLVLLAARYTWDEKVQQILDSIKKRVEATVGYMAEGLRKDLMSREFRKPGITAEVYLNASILIEKSMPDLYDRIRPEIKFIHETYFMTTKDEMEQYALKVFCPRLSISIDQLKERLKILDATVAAIQGNDYVKLRLMIQSKYQMLCTDDELRLLDKWYAEFQDRGYGFETYEPNRLPKIIQSHMRVRDTGNAFVNFATQVMKLPTSYTEAFSGKRPKGSDASMNNWLDRDPEYAQTKPENSYEGAIESFRQAYIKQSELRKEAQEKLNRVIIDRMDNQDRMMLAPSKIVEFGGDDGTLE